jgi:exonuclease
LEFTLGFLRALFNLIKNIQRSLTGSHPVSQLNLSHGSTSFATEPETIIENTWVIPTYQGQAICDYTEDIARYKREGNLNEALTLALGCLNSMRGAALSNHDYVMEYYVVQAAILQHKMKKYADEVALIKGWLDEGIPPAREDHRLDLLKRLAKAQELLAKQQSQDPTPYNREWKELRAQEVELKERIKAGYSPYTTARHAELKLNSGSSYSSGIKWTKPTKIRKRTSSSYIPTPELLAASTYVAVDFETANSISGASACQIALIKVQNGLVVDRLVSYLKPPAELRRFEFTHLHGISARTVRVAPTWVEILPAIAAFIGSFPVYAHNASFDSKVWQELDDYYNVHTVPTHFFCTYRMAKKALPHLENHKLPTVIKACAPKFKLKHHKADSDAEACAYIVLFFQTYGFEA